MPTDLLHTRVHEAANGCKARISRFMILILTS